MTYYIILNCERCGCIKRREVSFNNIQSQINNFRGHISNEERCMKPEKYREKLTEINNTYFYIMYE